MVLENKLDPEVIGYVGEKFNHFYPNALFIKDIIEFFVGESIVETNLDKLVLSYCIELADKYVIYEL